MVIDLYADDFLNVVSKEQTTKEQGQRLSAPKDGLLGATRVPGAINFYSSLIQDFIMIAL